MYRLKIAGLALVLLASCQQATSQSNGSLMGKWEAQYEVEGQKVSSGFEFKKDQGKLICQTLYLKDADGNGEPYSAVVMTHVDFKNGKGTARYTMKYEGETYEVDADLELTNAHTLKISYSYYGYSETETWKRVD